MEAEECEGFRVLGFEGFRILGFLMFRALGFRVGLAINVYVYVWSLL